MEIVTFEKKSFSLSPVGRIMLFLTPSSPTYRKSLKEKIQNLFFLWVNLSKVVSVLPWHKLNKLVKYNFMVFGALTMLRISLWSWFRQKMLSLLFSVDTVISFPCLFTFLILFYLVPQYWTATEQGMICISGMEWP